MKASGTQSLRILELQCDEMAIEMLMKKQLSHARFELAETLRLKKKIWDEIYAQHNLDRTKAYSLDESGEITQVEDSPRRKHTFNDDTMSD